MQVFEALDPRLREVLTRRGITEPTEPQVQAIPRIFAGEHLLLVAPTGIGKTEAAMLPILHTLAKTPGPGIQCLYITPLRALNRDMLIRLHEYGLALGMDVAVRHGDTEAKERARQSRTPPQVLITTPETVQILLLGRRLREHLKQVRHVIVDEVHELSEDERGAQLAVALERLVELAGEFQRLGLSATVGSVPEIARFLGGVGRSVGTVQISAAKLMKIDVEAPATTPQDQELAGLLQMESEQAAAVRRSRELVEAHRSTLFFVNTRDLAEALGVRYHLWDETIPIGVHHGSLSKEVRIQMEDDFKAERLRALICTSSLELGIDVGSIDLAIQYNSPRQVTRLIQRVGRAGHRVGERSVGKIVTTSPDEIAESLVIARRALLEELEERRIRENPLSVLANQLVAMTMGQPSIEEERAFAIVRRSYPFRSLPREKFDAVVLLLRQLKMLWWGEGRLRKSTKGMRYFFENISMIPDERTYRIRDISSRGIIGSLDESFVASYAEPYATFITRGRTWRVVEVREDEILVEQVREIGAVPSWIGEEIPVPFEVAQEVGALRRHLEFGPYPVDRRTAGVYRGLIERQGAKFPVPSDKLLLIEVGEKLLILHACFGSRVNDTIAKLLSTLLAAKLGESIGIRTDPYRIILELPRSLRAEELLKLLRETKAETLDGLLKLIVKGSTYLRWQFLYVAKKFGAIAKDADYKLLNLARLIEVFEGTPIYEEAIAKTLSEHMDVPRTALVLKRIQEHQFEVAVSGLTPLGEEGLRAGRELMLPRRADRTILMALKARLEKEDVILHCLNCHHGRRGEIASLPAKPACASCGGVMLAAVRPYHREDLALLNKAYPSEEELKEIRRLRKNADLVRSYGRKALLCLVARGIGPDTAGRILSSFHLEEEEFLRDILTAEVTYARTRRFWD